MGWSFAGIGLFGIQLELLNEEKRTLQLSILSSIGGVYGFLVSFVAGRFLSFLQQAGWSIGGNTLYAQQVTNSLGVVFLIALILYVKFIVQKENRSCGVNEHLSGRAVCTALSFVLFLFYMRRISLMDPLSWKISHSAILTA